MHNKLLKLGYWSMIAGVILLFVSILCFATDIAGLKNVDISSVQKEITQYFKINQEIFDLSIIILVTSFSLILFEVLRKDYIHLAGYIASLIVVISNAILSIIIMSKAMNVLSRYNKIDFEAVKVDLAEANIVYARNDIFIKLVIPAAIFLIIVSLIYAGAISYKYVILKRGNKHE